MQRLCNCCGKYKDVTMFSKNGKYLKHTCKSCECKRVQQGILKTVSYVQLQKLRCEICGYDKDKSVLEFHHKDNSLKLFNIGAFASSRMWSKKVKQQIDDEIKKCICLCANCHREKHSKEISNDIIQDLDFSFNTSSKSEIAKEAYKKIHMAN